MSDFFGLRVALSSLYAQRRALEVTGHNVANANTEGYSRQRVTMEAAGAHVTPAMHARWPGAGAGVGVTGVQRLYDQFLARRSMQEHATDGALRQAQRVLTRVELVFAEPGDTGLQAQLGDFWAGWDDVANVPDDLAARAQLLERAGAVAAAFNRVRDELGDLRQAAVEQLGTVVDEVNATAERVAELNTAIERARLAGLSPNDLMDQRDLLTVRLAEAVGASVRPGEGGTVDVYVGGTALVRGGRAEQLRVQMPAGTAQGSDSPVQVLWAKDGYRAAVSAGDVGGLLDGVNRALPAYGNGIDLVAAQLAEVVNLRHTAGFDLTGAPGAPLFSWDPATGMRLEIASPEKLAAAAEGPAPAPSLDGHNAAALGALSELDGGPDDAYRSFIVGLGVDAQTANRRVAIQESITAQVDAAALAESGVNLDEEMTNMVAYQHAYDAAARFMTSVDQMLDKLINGTGLVGR